MYVDSMKYSIFLLRKMVKETGACLTKVLLIAGGTRVTQLGKESLHLDTYAEGQRGGSITLHMKWEACVMPHFTGFLHTEEKGKGYLAYIPFKLEMDGGRKSSDTPRRPEKRQQHDIVNVPHPKQKLQTAQSRINWKTSVGKGRRESSWRSFP